MYHHAFLQKKGIQLFFSYTDVGVRNVDAEDVRKHFIYNREIPAFTTVKGDF